MSRGGIVRVTSYKAIGRNSVSQLKAAINNGIVTVNVRSRERVFKNYKSGIIDSSSCGTDTNHIIAAVGWGTSGSTDYYIVRNSWGSSWGAGGYGKIAARSGAGICGIQKYPYSATTN